MLSEDVFKTVMAGMCEMYDKEPSIALLDLYYDSLGELTDDEFKRAATYLVQHRKYANLPKPADFLEYIRGNQEDDALIAWHKVERAVRSECGSWQTPVFDDPVIHVAIARGFPNGWIGLCERFTEDNFPFTQRDFMASYNAYKNLPVEPPQLMGRAEGHNTMIGVAATGEPVFIGDPEKCKALVARIEQNVALSEKLMNRLTEGDTDAER